MKAGGVYLAYPIDQVAPSASLAHMYDQINAVKAYLIDSGIASWVFDPGDAFRVSRTATGDEVARINRCAAVSADAIVAFLPTGVATVGVPVEIDRAISQGKVVVLFTDLTASWMLQYRARYFAKFNGFQDQAIQAGMQFLEENEPLRDDGWKDADLFVQISDRGQMPKRAYDDDAGLDLVTSERTEIEPGEFADVPCGISVQLPEDSWGLVTGRSSALRKKGLLVHNGIIDAGYRGPIFAGAFNLTSDTVVVAEGERIAQLIVMHNKTRRTVPVRVDELSSHPRGQSGFGSTGA